MIRSKWKSLVWYWKIQYFNNFFSWHAALFHDIQHTLCSYLLYIYCFLWLKTKSTLTREYTTHHTILRFLQRKFIFFNYFEATCLAYFLFDIYLHQLRFITQSSSWILYLNCLFNSSLCSFFLVLTFKPFIENHGLCMISQIGKSRLFGFLWKFDSIFFLRMRENSLAILYKIIVRPHKEKQTTFKLAIFWQEAWTMLNGCE